MTELEIVLSVFASIFFLAVVTLLIKLATMFEHLRQLERSNAKLKGVIRKLVAESEEWKRTIAKPTEQNLTLLNQIIFRQQETIDELRLQLARQKQLLNQKWAGAKRNAG